MHTFIGLFTLCFNFFSQKYDLILEIMNDIDLSCYHGLSNLLKILQALLIFMAEFKKVCSYLNSFFCASTFCMLWRN